MSFSRWFVYIAALLSFVLASSAAGAAEPVLRDEEDDGHILSFSLENDLFYGEDDNYTNGVRMAYLSSEDDIPGWLEEGADAIPLFSKRGHKRWHGEIGQSMFAPTDLSVRTLQPNDRPYAGWLYGSLGVISDTGYRLDNLQLTLGVVGPASLAEQAQGLVHDVIGSPDPEGWDNQLANEPGIVLSYERKWRALYEFKPFGFGLDFTPSVGGAVGNVYTHAAVGGVARLGFDLPSDYGPPLIRPNLPGSDFFIPEDDDLTWYLFAGLEGRAVARNIFLDGNTFSNSHSVDKYPFVGGLQAGIAFTFDNTRVSYTHIFRTREFEGQDHNDAFGAITVAFRF